MSDNALTGTNNATFTTGAGDVTAPTITSDQLLMRLKLLLL
jgi:hypothetical protein